MSTHEQPSDILVLPCLLPGSGGLAPTLAGVARESAGPAFLVRWWRALPLAGGFVALKIARAARE
jgi:hypothetical protein